ncbi:TIGR00341 family protein [Flavobacterium tegetincola]|uniref:TIGR00341 family protein n=1 Tax=Flavobacterium tegetincola TaxID=150172 RepID=UPI00040BB632|nr:TIGR00341 family protein [Flavobacterium tegetincola]
MNKLTKIFNLHDGEDDREKTLEIIKKNIDFTGANLWILACAIIVASVGLNVNSTAVVIGAMLISPLMGPIVGAGFALGVYDFNLLKKSLRNLALSTIIGLVFSTLYFYISPFKDVQSEILARTTPNIYDILIAFFGGIVGVIAVTRVEKGNPIPGVAIATALMPPLCTAGFGLATANWSYFLGAIYLYCINCVFIGIATFLIIKYLKYAPKKQVDEKQQKQVRYIITGLILVMLVPSAYLAYNLYIEQQLKKNIELFIQNEFVENGHTIVYKRTDLNKQNREIELGFLTKRFDKKEIDLYNKKLNKYHISDTKLVILQDSTDRLLTMKGDILNEIRGSQKVDDRDIKIAKLENEMALNRFDDVNIYSESKILFPTIAKFSIANHTVLMEKDSTFKETVVIISSENPLSEEEKTKFELWLKTKLKLKRIQVLQDIQPKIVPTKKLK